MAKYLKCIKECVGFTVGTLYRISDDGNYIYDDDNNRKNKHQMLLRLHFEADSSDRKG